jgi:hypothetical protein
LGEAAFIPGPVPADAAPALPGFEVAGLLAEFAGGHSMIESDAFFFFGLSFLLAAEAPTADGEVCVSELAGACVSVPAFRICCLSSF